MEATVASHLRRGVQKDLYVSVRKHGGSDVPAFHDHTAGGSEFALFLDHPLAHSWMYRNSRGRLGYVFLPDSCGDVGIVELHAVAVDQRLQSNLRTQGQID